jgi:hypothetical protein
MRMLEMLTIFMGLASHIHYHFELQERSSQANLRRKELPSRGFWRDWKPPKPRNRGPPSTTTASASGHGGASSTQIKKLLVPFEPSVLVIETYVQ